MKKAYLQNIKVIETKKLFEIVPEGFIPGDETLLKKIEDLSEFKVRHKMEEDKSFQQLITYVAIIQNNKIFTYSRGNNSDESKLHQMYSFGVGGHVDEPDDVATTGVKEIEEEVGITVSIEDLKMVGIINISDSPVEEYHAGVAYILHVDNDFKIDNGEMDMLEERKFLSSEELSELLPSLENWSKVFYTKYLKDYLEK